MMMRMLLGAGLDIVTDQGKRDDGKLVTHKHSPYGSLEVKNVANALMGQDGFTKAETANKVFKVVCPYAPAIPVDRPVKAIFMQRDINEIITSLVAMKHIWDENIPETIAWTRNHLMEHDIPTLYVWYKDVVKYQMATALQIQDFLEVDLNIDGMVKAVDPNARTRYKTDKDLAGYKQNDTLLSMNKEDYQEAEVLVYSMPLPGETI